MSDSSRGAGPTRRQFLYWLGAAGLATPGLSVLAACQSSAPAAPAASGANSAPTATPAAQGSGAASSSKVQIRFLVSAGEPMDTIHHQLIDKFQQASPNIAVQFESVPFGEFYRKITTEAAGGSPPDVIWADGPQIKSLAYNKVIMSLEPWLYSKAELEDYVESSVVEGSFNGQVYAIPRRQSSEAIWYNVDVMDKAGIKPPSTLDQAWTFSQWRDAWKEVTKPGEMWGVVSRSVLGGGTYEALAFIRSAGAKDSPTYQAVSPDGKTVKGYLDTPEAMAGYQFWQDLIVKDKVTPPALVPQAFESGHAATEIYPESFGPLLKSTAPNLNVSVSPLPFFKAGFSHTGSFMYVVTTKSKYRDQAGAFIKFISNQENSQFWFDKDQQLPSRKSILNSAALYQKLPSKLFQETLLNWGVARPQTPAFTEYDQVVTTMFDNISKGASVNDAVKDAVSKIDPALAKYTS